MYTGLENSYWRKGHFIKSLKAFLTIKIFGFVRKLRHESKLHNLLIARLHCGKWWCECDPHIYLLIHKSFCLNTLYSLMTKIWCWIIKGRSFAVAKLVSNDKCAGLFIELLTYRYKVNICKVIFLWSEYNCISQPLQVLILHAAP